MTRRTWAGVLAVLLGTAAVGCTGDKNPPPASGAVKTVPSANKKSDKKLEVPDVEPVK